MKTKTQAKTETLRKVRFVGENRGAVAETARNVQNIPRKPAVKQKTVTRAELARWCYINSKKIPSPCVIEGVVKEWVGMGWVCLDRAPRPSDTIMLENDDEIRAPMKRLVMTIDLNTLEGMSAGQLDFHELHAKIVELMRKTLATPTLHMRSQVTYYMKTQAGKFR